MRLIYIYEHVDDTYKYALNFIEQVLEYNKLKGYVYIRYCLL